MKTELYILNTLSNLHVGSGDINFGVVDNQVQRDEISTLPIIHSSGLKGAFREYFEEIGDNANMVNYIFGSESTSDKHQAGAYSFFEAQLLSRPVRSNTKAYFSATSPSVIEDFLKTIENFNIAFDQELIDELKKLSTLNPSKPLIFENIPNTTTILEDYQSEYKELDVSKLETLLGKNIALLNDKDFQALDLPVIARNKLENGLSQNLWYEEVVPKKSKFFFVIGKPTNVEESDYNEKIKGFDNKFKNEGEIVQFGGNKSIGYGFSRVVKVSQ